MKRTKLITQESYGVVKDLLCTLDRLEVIVYRGLARIDHQTGETVVLMDDVGVLIHGS